MAKSEEKPIYSTFILNPFMAGSGKLIHNTNTYVYYLNLVII